MPLQPTNVQVLLGPRDGDSSPFLTTPGTLTRAENVMMVSPTELRRRPGSSLVAAADVDAKQLGTLNGELLSMAAGSGLALLQGINPNAGAAFTTRALITRPWYTSALESVADSNDQRSHDFIRSGTLDYHVYEVTDRYSGFDLNRIRVRVFDSVTRAQVSSFTVAVASTSPIPTRPAIWLVGSTVLVTYVNTAVAGNNEGISTNILLQQINSSGLVGGPVTVDTLFAGQDINGLSGAYDCQVRGSGILAMAYKVAGAVSGSRMRVREMSIPSLSVSTTSNGPDIATTANGDVGDTAIGFLNHNWSNSLYYVGSVASCALSGRNAVALHTCAIATSGAITDTVLHTSAGYGTLTSSMTGANPEAFRNVTGFVDASLTAHVFAESRSDGPAWPTPTSGGRTGADRYIRHLQRTSGGAVSQVKFVWGLGLASKPWTISGSTQPRCLMSYTSSIGPTYVVINLSTNNTYLGRLFSGVAGLVDADVLEKGTNARVYRPTRGSRLPTPQNDGAGNFTVAVHKLGPNSSAPSPQREAWIATLSEVDFSAKPIEVNAQLLFPGGVPRMYAGVGSLFEAGFSLPPEPLQGFTQSVGGSLTNNATYRYAYAYASKDVNGAWEISALSPEFSYQLTAGNNTISFDVPNYRNYFGKNAMIYIYRSEANPGTGAPLYFRYSIPAYFEAPALRFSDTGESFTPGEQEYTLNGTIFDNAPTPPMRVIFTWGRRAWGLLDENRKGFVWSKTLKDGFAAEWVEDFSGIIDDEYGELTGGAPCGERVLFFKRNAVYFLSGDGPTDDGNGGFANPLKLDGVPGAISQKSILATPDGVLYQAPDMRIWAIGFGLDSNEVGQPISDVTSAVTDVCYEPTLRHARFFDSVSGVTRVYDVRYKRWYTFTGQQIKASVIHNSNQHHLVGANVLKENLITSGTANHFTENGTTYQAVIELAWLSLAQLSGYMRTWAVTLLGRTFGAFVVSLEAMADFGTGVTTRSLDSTNLVVGHGTRIEAKIPMQMQQNTSLRLLVKDNSPPTGGGFGLDAITLQCGFAPGRRPRLPKRHVMT